MARISRRFQSRTMLWAASVPPETRCPRCHHDFEIVVSRKQFYKARWMRRMIRTYRCRVCDHRFCEWDPASVFRWTRAGFFALVCAIAVISWLAW